MVKRKSTFDYGKGDVQGVDTRGAGGGGSSSLQGSNWGRGEPRPTEMPKSKMELRMEQRKARAAQELPNQTRPSYEDWMAKQRKPKKSFRKGGMVTNDYRK